MQQSKMGPIEHFFFRWGGVLILLLVAAGLFEYETAIHRRNLQRLEERKSALLAAKNEAKHAQTRLRSILICQDDPEWVEYLLITKLGLIPSGSQKVKFND